MIFFIILIIGFSIYSNVLTGEFISDDLLNIVNNPAIRRLENIPEIWQAFNTRFLTGLTFAVNYSIGKLDPFGYHVFNVVIHAVVSYLVYRLILLIHQTPYFKNQVIKYDVPSLAIVAALIFLVHPIQTQAVAFITQRAALMGTALYLGTIIFYLKARLENNSKYFLYAFAAMFVGMFIKEMVITVPIALLLIELCFLSLNKRNWQTRLKNVLPYLSIVVFLPLLLSFDRTQSILGLKSQVTTQGFSGTYFLTEINVLRTYLRLLFFPVNLTLDYDYPLAKIIDGSVIVSAIVLLSVIVLVFWFFNRQRLISFCIVWFFMSLSVEFVIPCFAHRGVLNEHWLYLCMFGFSFFLSYLVHTVAKDSAGIRGIVTGILIVFCVMTYQRNKVWQTEIGFWEDALVKAPNKAGTHLGAGMAFQRKGKFDRAIEIYNRALELDPKFTEVHHNLGTIYFMQYKDELAEKNYKKVLEINPQFAQTHHNLANLYFERRKYSEAIKHYQLSLKFQGDYPDAYFFMGKCYLALGENLKDVKEILKRAKELYARENQAQKIIEINHLIESL